MPIIQSKELPILLQNIPDPPEKLSYLGNKELLKKTCIAVVGTRKNSDYGELMTQQIIEELAILDIAVVSGLALGIDAIAHKTALANGIPTIAVLGSSIDNLYPPQNKELAKEIAKQGLILSEFPPKTDPKNWHFLKRNRLISGLSIATIVVEAPEKSGAINTAKHALDQGREIFVIPGDVDRPNSVGILHLLQRGAAYPISSGKEIIKILQEQPRLFHLEKVLKKRSKLLPPSPKTAKTSLKKAPSFRLNPEELQILGILPKRRALSFQKLIEKSQFPVPELLSILSMLELQGLVENEADNYRRKF
jgi:DNA processing protein